MTNDTLSPEPEAAEVPALRRRSFRLPEEIGVIVALLVMIVVIGVARPRFQLAAFERISDQMVGWLRQRIPGPGIRGDQIRGAANPA